MPSKISVVIPAYNNSQILPSLILALRQQSLPPDEIIVADDGSTDNTADVAREHGAICLALTHGGPALARNRGAKKASGDIVVFIDTDCMPQAQWLMKLTEPLRKGIADVAKGAYVTTQKELAARFAQIEFEERYRKLAEQQSIDFVDSYSMAIKRKIFMEIGGFDGSFPRPDNEDVDLSYRLGARGIRMVFVADAVVAHLHPASWQKYFRVKIGRGYWRFKVYSRYPQKAIKDSYTPQTLKLQMLAVLLFPLFMLIALWCGQPLLVLLPISLFVVASIPMLTRSLKHSFMMLAITPWGLVVRALALVIGSMGGFCRFVLFPLKGEGACK